uniref:Replication protein-like n=1 Tax=Oryza sativa subsp. japonica TaxID=39947 RepID=Q8LHV4_ORYSJ|nr:replication protein-like [Oryza sativa Japonica Group]
MGGLQIASLEPGDGNPTLRIRISRLWEYRDQNDESILHYIGLVLVDQKPLITEGKVYLLTYYRVKPCTKHYRPVDNKLAITFTWWSETTNIALWGERATSFPADEIVSAGKHQPQIVIFVGTLVRGHGRNVSLSGNSACKWYINIDTPEVKSFVEGSYEPIKWLDLPSGPAAHNNGEEKTIAEIRELHPFKFKKHEFLVTVVIKKLNMEYSWWYTACDICKKTAKPYGSSYSRFKLSVIAGDHTADTTFIVFGRLAQRLIGRSVDALVMENPTGKDYIPREITDLLEKEFVWNVSFTENTVSSGIVAFQVNKIIKTETPSVGFVDAQLPLVSPSTATQKDKNIDDEFASKTPGEDVDDEHLNLTQKAPGSAAKSTTSKAYKKRPRPSPGTGAAKKLFKGNDADSTDDAAGSSNMEHNQDREVTRPITQPSTYAKKRPLAAAKFSNKKETSQLLADIIYQNAVVVKKALNQKTYTFRTTKLEFQPFKMNFDSTISPLRQRVILALEGVPPEQWNKEAITELLDNCCKIEELYVIEWNIGTNQPGQQSTDLNWKPNGDLSIVLIHIEKLFDYSDPTNGNEDNPEALIEYENKVHHLPIIKRFQWLPGRIDSDYGPIEGGTPLVPRQQLPDNLHEEQPFDHPQ